MTTSAPRTTHRGQEPRPALRIDGDAEEIGRGLGGLVVTLLDVVRQLIERQALRRVESGSLTAQQVERLGQALQELESRFAELREVFGADGDIRLPIDLDQLLSEPEPTRRK